MEVFIVAINDLQVGGLCQGSFTGRLCVHGNPDLQLRGNGEGSAGTSSVTAVSSELV